MFSLLLLWIGALIRLFRRAREHPSLDRLRSRLTRFCVETEGTGPRNTEAETSAVYTLKYNNTLSGIV